MGKVTHLHQVEPDPDPYLVESLTRLLDLAKSGQLSGLVYVGMLPDVTHVVGTAGVIDDRDLALAIVDIQDSLSSRRAEKQARE